MFIPDVSVGALYKFEIKTIDNQILLKSDPVGFSMEIRPSTASVITELSGFKWNDEKWLEQRVKRNPLSQPINVYEVHLASWQRIQHDSEPFNNRTLTYPELADRLIPYVKEMGYNQQQQNETILEEWQGQTHRRAANLPPLACLVFEKRRKVNLFLL